MTTKITNEMVDAALDAYDKEAMGEDWTGPADGLREPHERNAMFEALRAALALCGASRSRSETPDEDTPFDDDLPGGRFYQLEPWIAWVRAAPRSRLLWAKANHATIDGETTLCGIKRVGGHNKDVSFSSISEASIGSNGYPVCRRCVKKIDEARARNLGQTQAGGGS